MAARSGILCAGAWCVDRNISVNFWPPEETVATMLGASNHGGCPGHNMATALKRLGAPFPVEGAGLLGDDEYGRMLLQICDGLGVERSKIEMRRGVDTSLTLAMTARDTRKRTFFHQPGALAVQCPDDFDFSKTQCRIVHLGLAGLMPRLDGAWQNEVSGWAAVLKKARAVGLKSNLEMVSVEPEKIRAAGLPLLGLLDMLIVNDYEAGALAEIETIKHGKTDAAACRTAAEKLMAQSSLNLIAIHHPSGGIAMARNGDVAEHPAVNVPPTDIIGNNGAGDCFAAGILFGYHEGWALDKSLELAHACAASSLRSAATTESVVNWKECFALTKKWGWQSNG